MNEPSLMESVNLVSRVLRQNGEETGTKILACFQAVMAVLDHSSEEARDGTLAMLIEIFALSKPEGRKADKDGRYRTIVAGTDKFELRDDGYRIRVKWLDGRPLDINADEEILWAEYKQCDFPKISQVVADALMKP